MYLGRVIGTCVAEQKYEGLEGIKLLVVQPLSRARKAEGPPQIAADSVQAGVGDFVYLVGSREASMALKNNYVPVDAAIVGIIDDLHDPAFEAGQLDAKTGRLKTSARKKAAK